MGVSTCPFDRLKSRAKSPAKPALTSSSCFELRPALCRVRGDPRACSSLAAPRSTPAWCQKLQGASQMPTRSAQQVCVQSLRLLGRPLVRVACSNPGSSLRNAVQLWSGRSCSNSTRLRKQRPRQQQGSQAVASHSQEAAQAVQAATTLPSHGGRQQGSPGPHPDLLCPLQAPTTDSVVRA